MSISVPNVPVVVVHPPTPLPMDQTRHLPPVTFSPIALFDALEQQQGCSIAGPSRSSSYPMRRESSLPFGQYLDQHDEKENMIDLSLLSPPLPRKPRNRQQNRYYWASRNRYSSNSKEGGGTSKPTFLGLSFIFIAFIVLMTSVISLSNPIYDHHGIVQDHHQIHPVMLPGTGGHSSKSGTFGSKFRLAMDLAGGSGALRDITLKDVLQWSRRDSSTEGQSSVSGNDEMPKRRRALSHDAWKAYKRTTQVQAGGAVPTNTMELWDFQ